MLWEPIQFGGVEIINIEVEQGILQIKLFLEHGGTQTITGQLIMTSLEKIQLESGELEPVLTLPYLPYKSIITKSWIVCLW